MYVYNTLTRKKEELKTIEPGKLKMYVCGPTVYDYCHLGHGRAYVSFDIIYRYMKYQGYEINYVRNITDIDDKIIARANEMDLPGKSLKEKVKQLTGKYIKEFLTDMAALNIQPPTTEPRATEYIPKMIVLIEKLIEKGYAYAVGGDVYYAVEKYKDYGCLSGRQLEELQAGARVEPDKKKKNPLDFALWKEAKPQEPAWDSPWGQGRPGWHMECSAMSLSLLGAEFDLHGGGQDLIFPHHENEIAQSYGCNGKQPVHYWVHNGFVTINRQKMSKSLGNFFTLKEILAKYRPAEVRLFLLTQHYRSPIDFSDQLLEEARTALERIEDCLLRAKTCKSEPNKQELQELRGKFCQVMDDDFNAPQALALVFDLVRETNNLLLKEKDISAISTSVAAIKEFLEVLGIEYRLATVLDVKNEEASEIPLEEYLALKELTEEQVKALVACRLFLKKQKKWPLADKVRDHLIAKGYSLRDKSTGTECIK